MDLLTLFAMVPPTIVAAAAWRSSRKNSPNGAFEEIKQMVWFQGEEIAKLKWFIMEQRHIDDQRKDQ